MGKHQKNDVIGIDKHHILQIMHGLRRQILEIQNDRDQDEDDHGPDQGGYDRHDHQVFGVFLFCREQFQHEREAQIGSERPRFPEGASHFG